MKKSFSRFIAMLLLVTMVMTLVPVQIFAEEPDGGTGYVDTVPEVGQPEGEPIVLPPEGEEDPEPEEEEEFEDYEDSTVTLTDIASGVAVSGELPEGTVLTVIPSGPVNKGTKKNPDYWAYYIISLSDGQGNKVQPESAVEVRLPVYESDGLVYSVWCIQESVDPEDMGGYRDGDRYIFSTDHFGRFGLRGVPGEDGKPLTPPEKPAAPKCLRADVVFTSTDNLPSTVTLVPYFTRDGGDWILIGQAETIKISESGKGVFVWSDIPVARSGESEYRYKVVQHAADEAGYWKTEATAPKENDEGNLIVRITNSHDSAPAVTEPVTTNLTNAEFGITVSDVPDGAVLKVGCPEEAEYMDAVMAAVGGEFFEAMAMDIKVTDAEGGALTQPATIRITNENFKHEEALPDNTPLYHVTGGEAQSIPYMLNRETGTLVFTAQDFSPFVMAVKAPDNGANAAPLDGSSYTVTIRYLSAVDGSNMADPATRTVEIGTAFQEDIVSPVIAHFEADQTVVSVDLPDTQEEDVTYTVLYKETVKTIEPDYIAGNAYISKFTLDTANKSYEVKNQSAAVLFLRTGFDLEAESDYLGFNNVDVSYRFLIPRYLQSGGELKYSGYAFLSSARTQNVTVDGVEYIQLTGVSKVHSATNQTIPGEVRENLGVTVASGANGDTFTVYGEAWLTKDGETRKLTAESPEFHVTADLKDIYDLCEYYGGGLKTSGYYNPATHAFYPTAAAKAAAGDEDAVYGRFFAYQSLVRPVDPYNTVGQELIHKATYDINYRLEITEPDGAGGKVTRYETGEYRPILVDAYVYDAGYGKNSKQGFVYGNDATVGGYVDPNIGAAYSGWVPQTAHTYTGTDTQTAEGGKLSVTAVYNEGTRFVNVAEIIFVPTIAYPEDTSWTLHIYHNNLEIEGMSGTVVPPNADATPLPTDSGNFCNLPVARKAIGGRPGMSQVFTAHSVVRGISTGVNITGRVSVPAADYNAHEITAGNVFIKVDTAGLQITGGTPGGAFGASSKKLVLYACKPDGSGWASEDEMYTTDKESLIYFASLADAQAHGTVVAALFTYRDGFLTTGTIDSTLGIKCNAMDRTYACILESEIWSDDNVNPTDYSDAKGVTLSDPAPSNAIRFKTAGYNYKKVEWEGSTAVPQDSNGAKYGFTVKVVGYTMNFGSGGAVMNGQNPGKPAGGSATYINNSTFNISDGERTVAAASTMVIRWMGSEEDPKLPLDFSVSCFYSNQPYNSGSPDSKLQHVGKTYLAPLDAAVTWNSKTEEFESSDPRFREIDPAHFTVEGAGEYTIYHTLHIGDETDLSKDPAIGSYRERYFHAKLYGDCGQYLYIPSNDGNVNYNWIPVSVTINKNALVSLVKSHIAPFVAPAADFGYTMIGNSLKAPTEGYQMLDILPYNGDGRGTDLKGGYHLKDDQISVVFSSSTDSITSTMKMYYTTDPAVRGKGDAATMGAFNTGSLGVSWQEMTASDVTEGNVKRKVITYSVAAGAVPTAIAYVGDMGMDNQFYITLKFDADGAANGSVYCNNATIDAPGLSTHPITSGTAKTQFIGRELNGVVWIDTNRNGKFDQGEQTVSGVTLELYKASGDQVTADAFGTAYGKVVSGDYGTYSFKDFADSADTADDNQWIVRAVLTEAQKKLYEPTELVTGAEGETVSHMKYDSAKENLQTDAFAMDTYAKQIINEERNATLDRNVGLVPKYVVTYKLVGDADYGIPEGLTAPVDSNVYLHGDTVTVADGQSTTWTTSDGTEDGLRGVWSFTPWTTDDAVIEDGEFVIERDTLLTGVWTFTPYGDLIVSKTVDGNACDKDMEFHFTVKLEDDSINGEYAPENKVDGDRYMTFTDGVAEFDLKDGESVSAVDLPNGLGYEVIEDDYQREGYVAASVRAKAKISFEKPAEAMFTNTRNANGSLTIGKSLAGNGAEENKDFTFTITLTDGEEPVSGKFSGVTFNDNGEGTITLKGGETMTFDDLPNGTDFTVKEADYTADGYECDQPDGVSGTISETEPATAQFTNTRLSGNLVVEKQVKGDGASDTDKFAFTVTLGDETVTGTYGDMTFKNGVAKFTLKHGEKATAEDLPAAMTFTVAEAEYDDYEVTKSGDTGSVMADKTVTAKFTNTFIGEEDDDPVEPTEGNHSGVPKTGDHNNMMLWVLLLIGAVAVMVVTLFIGKGYKGKYTR